MSLNVTLNGSVYIIPETGEVGWGGNTTSYLVAIAAGTLQKTGGSFTLSSEIDFGASFGLKSLYYKSRSANVAAAGILRLNNNSDSINWRNAANSADLSLFPNASNLLTFNGSTVYVIGAGTITNADIAAGAGIVYSKLNLSNSIVNADINTAAAIDYTKLNIPAGAIVYSKLTLTNSIVNADINSAAAIAFSKMAALTASRMLVSTSGGVVTTSAWSYDGSDNLTTGVQDELRFQDAAGGEYVALRAPTAVTTHSYDLPTAPGTAGQVLSWQTGGQLTWINATGTGTINSGLTGFFTYYPANGTTVDDQALLSTDLTNITLTSGQYRSPNGTTALPTYSFTGDPNTGIYTDGTSGRINFSSDGTEVARIENGQLRILTGNDIIGGTTSRVKMDTGSSSLPVYTFSGDLDTGIYNAGANEFTITAGANIVADFLFDGTRTLITSSSTRLQFGSGSSALPTYSFSADTDTGVYNAGANECTIVAGANVIADFLFDGTNRLVTASSTRFQWGDGTAALPAYSFSADTDTGMFRSAANSLDFATGGSSRMTLDTTQLATSIVFRGPSGSATAPTYAFTAEAGLGWYRGGAARMSLAFGTVEGAFFDGTTGVFGLSNNYNMQTNVGTAAAPGYSFNGDSDTGAYRVGANSFGISAGGSVVMTFAQAQLEIYNAGSKIAEFNASRLRPETDNSLQLGSTTLGWKNIYLGDGTVSLPAVSYSADNDTGLYRKGANAQALVCGGQETISFGNGVSSSTLERFNFADGSLALPGISFANDTDTGIFRNGANSFQLVVGGAVAMNIATGGNLLIAGAAGDFSTNRILPNADNTNNLGSAGQRWATVFAATGTINTSHSSTKTNIVDLDPEVLEVPRAVLYDRDGRRHMGYLNDSLPDVARPTENGKVVPTMNYENAVIGILCAHVRKLEERLAILEGREN